ncbi:MAG: hypothetical protein ABI601_01910 [bacterium]
MTRREPIQKKRSDIMFSVLADEPGHFRLEDGTGAVAGWIRGRSIGFRGLHSEAEAIVVASAGWRTLQSLLHREYAAWPRQEVDWERLRFVNDGAHEWVSDGRIPLARMYRTNDDPAHGRGDVTTAHGSTRQLAIEFVTPSWMHEDSMIPLAHALWHVLAPLLGERSRTIGALRHASHSDWLPSTHVAAVKTPNQVLVG